MITADNDTAEDTRETRSIPEPRWEPASAEDARYARIGFSSVDDAPYESHYRKARRRRHE